MNILQDEPLCCCMVNLIALYEISFFQSFHGVKCAIFVVFLLDKHYFTKCTLAQDLTNDDGDGKESSLFNYHSNILDSWK